MFFLRKAKVCIFRCLFADCCVCVWLSVWEWVYSQVLADILGLCGCGWWLAFCADNREGTASFFLYFYLLVCVCEYNVNINSILYLFQTDKLFVTRLRGVGFRCSATSVHTSVSTFGAICLSVFELCEHLFFNLIPIWSVNVPNATRTSILCPPQLFIYFKYSYKARQGKFIGDI